MTPKKPAGLPIRTTVIALDEIGYDGWYAEMRLNIRARTYDDLLSQDQERFWAAFGDVVVAWNFVNEDGSRMDLPREGLGPRDLPIDILNTLVLRYVEAMADSAAIPKARDVGSATFSRTNGTSPTSAVA